MVAVPVPAMICGAEALRVIWPASAGATKCTRAVSVVVPYRAITTAVPTSVDDTSVAVAVPVTPSVTSGEEIVPAVVEK